MNEVEKWEQFEAIHDVWKGTEAKAVLQKGLLVVQYPGYEQPAFTYAVGGEAREWVEQERQRRDLK